MHKKSLILATLLVYFPLSFPTFSIHHSSYSSPCNSSPIYRIRVTPNLTNIAVALIGTWGVKLGVEALWREWQRNQNQTAENEAALQEITAHLKREHPAIYERLENLSQDQTKISNHRWDVLLNATFFGSLVALLVATLANAKFFTVTSGYNSHSF